MKGAIGNAFILNMVITFILIFYSLLIASMALTKTYKVKNYLLNHVASFDSKIYDGFKIDNNLSNDVNLEKYKLRLNMYWNEYYEDETDVVVTLSKFGYFLANDSHCPIKDGYIRIHDTKAGSYDYCVYIRYDDVNDNDLILARYNYMVLVYMKFDFPVVGNFVKVPVTGETKTITVFK